MHAVFQLSGWKSTGAPRIYPAKGAPVSVRRIVSDSALPHPRLLWHGLPMGIHFST